jgi:DNA-binding transcriptional LysR family regulator
MELRHLRYFVAVAEARNFTRAAEQLHIAQPPLSRQIQQLEEILDVALFVRGSRPLQMTEAGEFFYGHAQQLLAQSAELVSMTRRVGKITQKFTMGFVGSTLFGLLPEVVRRFRAAHPERDFNLLEMTTMEQIRALKDGTIDVGIGRIRHEDTSVRRIILREEPLIVALPMGHPLSQVERGLHLRELVKDTLVVYPKAPRPSYADAVLAAFHDRGLAPSKVYEARELQVGLGLVAAGVGVSVLPKSVLGLRRSDVVYKMLDEPNLTSPVIMSIRALDRADALRSLLDVIYGLYRSEGIPHTPESL